MTIEGFTGRDPVGVAASVGRKDPERGHPIDKDRFFLVQPRENRGRRESHPAFQAFNKAGQEKWRTQTIRGTIMHANRDACFLYNLSGYRLPGLEAPPNKRPTCTGDGTTATRWVDGEFKTIKCPNTLCSFRQEARDEKTGRKYIPCKPFGKLIFLLRWQTDTLPAMMCKYTTGGRASIEGIIGLFDLLEDAAKSMGIEAPHLFGSKFSMTVTEQTSRERQARYPVVVFTPEESPLDFFARTQKEMAAIGHATPVPLRESVEASPEVLADDAADLLLTVPSRER